LRQEISGPSRKRLLQFLHLLEKHTAESSSPINSARMEQLTGWPRDTIRKDISCLDGILGKNAGYEPNLLMSLIKKALGLDRRRKFCVVGLGRLGSAYLNSAPPLLAEFELAAGFDSNVNRVEILQSPVPLYPAYKMAEIIGRFGIEIALLCVPAEEAQAAAEKCAAAGIKGIINFAPAVLSLPGEITVNNVYLTDALRSLTIQMRSFYEESF